MAQPATECEAKGCQWYDAATTATVATATSPAMPAMSYGCHHKPLPACGECEYLAPGSSACTRIAGCAPSEAYCMAQPATDCEAKGCQWYYTATTAMAVGCHHKPIAVVCEECEYIEPGSNACTRMANCAPSEAYCMARPDAADCEAKGCQWY